MDLTKTDRTLALEETAWRFMKSSVFPAEKTAQEQVAAASDPHAPAPITEELKKEARTLGLWNLFLPDPKFGAGLTNLEYAHIAEITGWSELAPLAMNCSSPDTGNMEILAMFGTTEQQQEWLIPLLDGKIRSCFSMTEPAVASSDATNIATRVTEDGDELVVSGRKWFTSGANSPRCTFAIVMARNVAEGVRNHQSHSMVIVPLDTPGVEIVRSIPVFSHDRGHGHAEIVYHDVRVPRSHLLGNIGSGFSIAQARLGPGRIHHCMRAIGMCERALSLMVDRVLNRTTWGRPLAEQGMIQDWIAQSRIDIEQARLLILKTAYLMDTVGNKAAAVEISAIKVLTANLACAVLDRAIQSFGAAGVTDDFPLAAMFAKARTLRIADGPDEVHKRKIARAELARERLVV